MAVCLLSVVFSNDVIDFLCLLSWCWWGLSCPMYCMFSENAQELLELERAFGKPWS